MKTNIKEIKATYSDAKRAIEKDQIWLYYVVRPLSFRPAVWFINSGISANKVTTASIIFVLISAILIAFGNLNIALLGALSLFMWGVLDCSDGTVARFTKKTDKEGSYLGEFLDAAGAYAVYGLIIPALGLFTVRGFSGFQGLNLNIFITGAAEKYCGLSSQNIMFMTLYISFWSALSGLTSRLLFQKYKNLQGNKTVELKRSENSKGLKKTLVKHSQNIISAVNLFLPLLIIALITGGSLWYILIYALLNTAMLFFTIMKIVKELQ